MNENVGAAATRCLPYGNTVGAAQRKRNKINVYSVHRVSILRELGRGTIEWQEWQIVSDSDIGIYRSQGSSYPLSLSSSAAKLPQYRNPIHWIQMIGSWI